MSDESENVRAASRKEVEELLVSEERSFYDRRPGRLIFAALLVLACLNMGKFLIRIISGSQNEFYVVDLFLGFVLPVATITLFIFMRVMERKYYDFRNLKVAEHNLTVFEHYRESLQEKRLLLSRTPSTVAGLSSLDQLEAEIREADNEINRRRERVAYHRTRQRNEPIENLESQE